MKDIPIRKIHAAQDEPNSSENFSIRKVENLLDQEGLFQELHRHDFFYILVLEKGEGNHDIDFTSYDVCDNSVFFLRPGQVHQLRLKTGSTGYIMVFTVDFYHPHNNISSQPLRIASNKNLCLLETQRFKRLFATIAYIFQEYTAKQEGYQEVIKANLSIFFIELIRQRKNSSNPSGHENPYMQQQLEKFIELLETNITTLKQVSQYAEMLNLTTYQLNAITKKSLNKTSSELINEYIILESKRYLLATSNQVNQIAYHLGYEDVSYFIRFFKKHTGHTPDAFRQNFK